jgi:TonB-dependent receptor
MYSDNFDISFELYFANSGIFSIGLFAKKIDGFIAGFRDEIGEGHDYGWSEEYYGFTYTTSKNLNKARVRGIELNYSQALTFLPAALKRVRVNANTTIQDTSGQFDNGVTELPRFKDLLVNLGFQWNIGKFQVRANYNYNSSFLNSIGSTDMNRIYVPESRTLDANFQWQFNSKYVLFCDLNNILNEPHQQYVVSRKYLCLYEINGMRLNVGVRGRF